MTSVPVFGELASVTNANIWRYALANDRDRFHSKRTEVSRGPKQVKTIWILFVSPNADDKSRHIM